MAGTDDIFDATLLRKLIDEEFVREAKRLTTEDINVLLRALDAFARVTMRIHRNRAELEAEIGKDALDEYETHVSLNMTCIDRLLATRGRLLAQETNPTTQIREELNGSVIDGRAQECPAQPARESGG